MRITFPFLASVVGIGVILVYVLAKFSARIPGISHWLTAVGVLLIFFLEVAFILLLGSTGDRFDPRCMSAEAPCERSSSTR
jgi:hypothetical protein